MKIYMVGGAVRDGLLGQPVQDRDWVVVGATPEVLAAAGYTPVGKDFPVFLHPVTHEEVALARTERKMAPGYHGFVFHADADVTLEEDLARRDLTINAIAQDESGALIDPYHGQRDLRDKVLRHVTPAFAEDPVRILRVARFAARYVDFSIAPETMALMRQMVAAGEVDALVPERVWQELSRGLMERMPSRMIEALRACGALARVLPEVDGLFGQVVSIPQALQPSSAPQDAGLRVKAGEHVLRTLDASSQAHFALSICYALLLHMPGGERTHDLHWCEMRVQAASERLRVPASCAELAILAAQTLTHIHTADHWQAAQTLEFIERCDAFRRPERFDALLKAARCDAACYPLGASRLYVAADRLDAALQKLTGLDTKAVTQAALGAGAKGKAIGRAVHDARLTCLQQVWPL